MSENEKEEPKRYITEEAARELWKYLVIHHQGTNWRAIECLSYRLQEIQDLLPDGSDKPLGFFFADPMLKGLDEHQQDQCVTSRRQCESVCEDIGIGLLGSLIKGQSSGLTPDRPIVDLLIEVLRIALSQEGQLQRPHAQRRRRHRDGLVIGKGKTRFILIGF